MLPGIKLPRSEKDWKIANMFFHVQFDDLLRGPICTATDQVTESFQSTIYNYFATHFGTVNKMNDSLNNKYSGLSVKSLKKALHALKNNKNTQSVTKNSEQKQCLR